MSGFFQIFMPLLGVIVGFYIAFLFYDRMAGVAIRYAYRRLIAKNRDVPTSSILLKTMKSRFVFKKFSDDVCQEIIRGQSIQNIDELVKFLGVCEKYYYKTMLRKGYFFTKIEPEMCTALKWRKDESVTTSQSKFRMQRWMPIYSVIFFLFTIGFVYDNIENHYHWLYVVWSILAYSLMSLGNIFYIKKKSNKFIASAWKIIVPILVIDFISSGIIDMRYSTSAGKVPIFANIFIWIMGALIFLPTFIANFSLGYATKLCNKNKSFQPIGITLTGTKDDSAMVNVRTVEDVDSAIGELIHMLGKEDKHRDFSNALQHKRYGVRWESKIEYFNEISSLLSNFIATNRQNVDEALTVQIDKIVSVIGMQAVVKS